MRGEIGATATSRVAALLRKGARHSSVEPGTGRRRPSGVREIPEGGPACPRFAGPRCSCPLLRLSPPLLSWSPWSRSAPTRAAVRYRAEGARAAAAADRHLRSGGGTQEQRPVRAARDPSRVTDDGHRLGARAHQRPCRRAADLAAALGDPRHRGPRRTGLDGPQRRGTGPRLRRRRVALGLLRRPTTSGGAPRSR